MSTVQNWLLQNASKSTNWTHCSCVWFLTMLASTITRWYWQQKQYTDFELAPRLYHFRLKKKASKCIWQIRCSLVQNLCGYQLGPRLLFGLKGLYGFFFRLHIQVQTLTISTQCLLYWIPVIGFKVTRLKIGNVQKHQHPTKSSPWRPQLW